MFKKVGLYVISGLAVAALMLWVTSGIVPLATGPYKHEPINYLWATCTACVLAWQGFMAGCYMYKKADPGSPKEKDAIVVMLISIAILIIVTILWCFGWWAVTVSK